MGYEPVRAFGERRMSAGRRSGFTLTETIIVALAEVLLWLLPALLKQNRARARSPVEPRWYSSKELSYLFSGWREPDDAHIDPSPIVPPVAHTLRGAHRSP